MTSIRWSVALLLVIPPAIAAPVPKELKGNTGDPFPTAVGTRWEYVIEGTDRLDHTREVTVERKEKDGSRYAEIKWTSHAGRYGETTSCRVDNAGVARLGFGQGHRFAVPFLLLKAGTKSGDTWDAGVVRPGPAARAAYSAQRGQTETVTTPAGKFRASPVTIGGTDTYWYALGVGLVKWKNGTRTIVLSKFTAGTEAKK